MTCAKIFCTGLVAGLIVAASEATATSWLHLEDLPASVGGSVQAQTAPRLATRLARGCRGSGTVAYHSRPSGSSGPG